ncbi:hypothetical protein Dsin_015571 [Dipteronia sinensis]|uniref:Reverse transcriptase domain-containing protein n=1 Tax=Dipteronia sinensis TaxID=43782 RepID=A0AAE0ACU5_9ROSI|nr:hypothetical protein Dsin_015571 [Dipteronia sinensis]
MNPNILPPETWKSHTRYFKAADGKIFTTNLISKTKIGIKIFPSYTIWTQVLGTSLPVKISSLAGMFIANANPFAFFPLASDTREISNSFSHIPNIFPLSEIQPTFQHIQQKLLQFCINSHAEFTHQSSLWKNPNFFVHLPFKLNEDINPTKATHSGMSPTDLQLATAEYIELLSQDDRHKSAFCLPNAHYQWTVLPFGLKTAPSLFQKAVTRIFHPLLHSALLYIDDILMFSSDEQSHAHLFQQFHDIMQPVIP